MLNEVTVTLNVKNSSAHFEGDPLESRSIGTRKVESSEGESGGRSTSTLPFCLLELGRLRDGHEGIDGGKVGWFEQAASLEKLAGVEATGNQRL